MTTNYYIELQTKTNTIKHFYVCVSDTDALKMARAYWSKLYASNLLHYKDTMRVYTNNGKLLGEMQWA